MHTSVPIRRAVGCLVIGASVAVAWDVFVRLNSVTVFGLGWSSFLLASTIVVVAVAAWLRRPLLQWPLLLVFPIVILAVDVALYANPASDFFAGAGGAALIGVLAYWLLGEHVAWREMGWIVGGDVVAAGMRFLRGLAATVRVLVASDGHRHRWREVAMGGLLAIPFLILFTVLFAGADPAIARAIERLVDAATIETLWRVVRRVILAIAVVGLSGSILLLPPPFADRDPRHRSVQPVVAATFFTLLNLLFAAFIAIEVVQLIRAVGAPGGATLAGAARRSFGELVVASVLAWGLGAVWYRVFIADRADRTQRWASRCLSMFLWLTVALAVLTAVQILRYTDAYGLSRARVYALVTVAVLTTAVGYLAIAGWRRVPVVRIGRVLSAGMIVAFTLVMSAPVDRFVAEWNVWRQLRGGAKVPFDLDYLGYHLSADAGPAFARYARVDRAARERLLGDQCASLDDWSPRYNYVRIVPIDTDWRGWNYFERRWCRALPRIQEELRAIDASRSTPQG